ncbi:hypothetical protein U1Q18_016194 [Sarracenia purpurea var. burkii]
MESKTTTRSILASFSTFQFLCRSRSSRGRFFASFNNFSSFETILVLIVKLERVLQLFETAIVDAFVSIESASLQNLLNWLTSAQESGSKEGNFRITELIR